MIIDLRKYSSSINKIKIFYEKNKDQCDVIDLINRISIMTGIPLAAIVKIILLLYGSNEVLEKQLESLTQFYQYDKIIGDEYIITFKDS